MTDEIIFIKDKTIEAFSSQASMLMSFVADNIKHLPKEQLVKLLKKLDSSKDTVRHLQARGDKLLKELNNEG